MKYFLQNTFETNNTSLRTENERWKMVYKLTITMHLKYVYPFDLSCYLNINFGVSDRIY